MAKKTINFWFKGHQILAVQKSKNSYHFFVCYANPMVKANDSLAILKKLIGFKWGENAIIAEPFIEKNAYSMYAICFIRSKKKGLELAEALCMKLYDLEGPIRKYKEYEFSGEKS